MPTQTQPDRFQQYKASHTAPIHYKSVAQQATIDDVSRRIEFYFAVWGKKDINGEISVKGCMTKSILEHGPLSKSPQKIIFLYQHDQSLPLGRIVSITEDDFGCKAVAEFDNIALANDVITQIKSGTLNQFSYGFKYVWDKTEYDKTTSTISLKEVRMMEISVVSIGASEDTRFLGFKSVNIDDASHELIEETELFIKSLDTTKQLQARSIISKHIALSQKAGSIDSLLKDEPLKGDLKEAINNFKF